MNQNTSEELERVIYRLRRVHRDDTDGCQQLILDLNHVVNQHEDIVRAREPHPTSHSTFRAASGPQDRVPRATISFKRKGGRSWAPQPQDGWDANTGLPTGCLVFRNLGSLGEMLGIGGRTREATNAMFTHVEIRCTKTEDEKPLTLAWVEVRLESERDNPEAIREKSLVKRGLYEFRDKEGPDLPNMDDHFAAFLESSKEDHTHAMREEEKPHRARVGRQESWKEQLERSEHHHRDRGHDERHERKIKQEASSSSKRKRDTDSSRSRSPRPKHRHEAKERRSSGKKHRRHRSSRARSESEDRGTEKSGKKRKREGSR